MDACQVECFCWRRDDDGFVGQFFAYGGEYGVRTFKDEIAVDFIAHDDYIMLEANLSE